MLFPNCYRMTRGGVVPLLVFSASLLTLDLKYRFPLRKYFVYIVPQSKPIRLAFRVHASIDK